MKLQASLDNILLQKILRWASRKYEYLAYFTDNNIPYPHSGFTPQLLAGNRRVRHDDPSLAGLEVVGLLSYDYKNQLENLKSENPVIIDHPDEVFFLPDIKISFDDRHLILDHPHAQEILHEINATPLADPLLEVGKIIALTPKADYIRNVNQIKHHITEGDIYELNYCIAFQAAIQKPDPVDLFLKLIKVSPMPFSVFFKAKNQVLLCASPERFLKKEASKIIAQPIKGTIKRGKSVQEDEAFKNQLLHSEKERAENLMIVDLMRNDLSKISVTGSVNVEELFGIYTFKTSIR
jgi:para-aminobenzoate synthetase component I